MLPSSSSIVLRLPPARSRLVLHASSGWSLNCRSKAMLPDSAALPGSWMVDRSIVVVGAVATVVVVSSGAATVVVVSAGASVVVVSGAGTIVVVVVVVGSSCEDAVPTQRHNDDSTAAVITSPYR